MDKQNKITLLYVDDEEINLFLFEKNLQSHFNIIKANSGSEGLKKLEQYAESIIVVVSDMRMPLMNGLEFISIAKEKYKNIAYFILTGFDYSEDIETALKKNLIHKYFTKPLDTALLIAAINEAAENLVRS